MSSGCMRAGDGIRDGTPSIWRTFSKWDGKFSGDVQIYYGWDVKFPRITLIRPFLGFLPSNGRSGQTLIPSLMRAGCAELDTVNPNKEEQVILDGNKEAKKYSFYMLGSYEVSPDHTKLAYAEDTTGGCLPQGLPALQS